MEHQHSNKLVAEVDTGCPTLEAVTNHLVGTVNVAPLEFGCRCWRLNTKINSMLDNNVLCDVDVRDLYSIMQELGVRHQWKEMNEKIRAELEGISKHVDAATQVLDANPPEFKYRWNHCTGWFVQPATVVTEESTTVEEPATTPEVTPKTEPESDQEVVEEEVVEEDVVEEEVVEEDVVEEDVAAEEEAPMVEEPKVISCTLNDLPWQRWHCQLNKDIANANVDTIIPTALQTVECKLFGEWDQFMADVVEWHRRGLQRFHVRMCMCQYMPLTHCQGQ